MRTFFFTALLISTAAFAQNDNSMLVVGGDQKDARSASEIEHERVLNNFPENAVTRLGSSVSGTDKDVPSAPVAPAAPGAEAIPASPPSPPVPAAPANAVSKLWPADTVPIFMQSCANYQPKLVLPCNCVIGKLMLAMPHNEFLELTAKGTIEQDVRVQNIRNACAVKAAAEQ